VIQKNSLRIQPPQRAVAKRFIDCHGFALEIRPGKHDPKKKKKKLLGSTKTRLPGSEKMSTPIPDSSKALVR
jgi:hypothetical protein